MNRVITWFKSLDERERLLVLATGGLSVLVIAYLILASFYKAVNAGATRVERKQQDLAWMRSVAPMLRNLSASQPGASGESLFVIVDRTARQAGLPSAVTTPNGERGVRVRLEGANFDIVVVWLANLQQQYGIGIESANFDSAGKSGIVNASLVLMRGGPG
jgi:general secretion pathway protein M